VSEDQAPNQGSKAQATVIKKYANRRLYNTATSTYVTLEDLAAMVKNAQDFLVYDAKTGEDITRSVLTQIIFEEENKGGAQTLLPVNFLRNLIRFYGDQMQCVVPGYLDFSLDNLMKDQGKIRQQMLDAMGVGAEPFKGMEEQAKRNMAMFNDAVKMFNPFANVMGGMPGMPGMAGAASKPQEKPAASGDDLQALKDQLAAMQQKLDTISR
jgi:polyhydroxyalkanoate synthesis repressor PhaR